MGRNLLYTDNLHGDRLLSQARSLTRQDVNANAFVTLVGLRLSAVKYTTRYFTPGTMVDVNWESRSRNKVGTVCFCGWTYIW